MANTLKFGDGKWATGEGTALAFNDENDNFKPLPFTFTRASKATVVNQSGLIEEVGNDVPRIDFKDNTKGALLLEPSRTNLYRYSEDFIQGASGTGWTKFGSAFATSNQTVSPDGTLNADKISIGTTQTSTFGVYVNNASISPSGSTFALSYYFKPSEVQFVQIYFGGGQVVSGSPFANFDIVNGVLGTVSSVLNASIEPYLNDFYKVTVTGTASGATLSAIISAIPSATSPRNTANSWTLGDGFFIWGAQLEQGSYATSYIKTEGSAVTRVADSNIQQNIPNSVVGQTEGTVYVNLSWTEISTNIYYVFSDGTSSNRILIYSTSESGIFILIQSGGATSASFSITSQDARVLNKIAISYKNNDFKVAINGEIKGTDTSGNIPVGINFTEFLIYGKIEENKIYNTALTDAELITLTT